MKPTQNSKESDLVRYSRAGDAFHYRWAARRCIRMIDPRYPVFSITIEASRQPEKAGECAIDLAEYAESAEHGKCIHYVQLKHSTLRTSKSFGIADFEGTLAAFAARYSAHSAAVGRVGEPETVSFSLVTNRHFSVNLSKAFAAIREGRPVSAARKTQLEKATGLSGDFLRLFLSSLTVVDGEGDYVVQREELHGELGEYVAGFVESEDVDKIVLLVSDRALPATGRGRRKGEILREDVLKRLGASTNRLFPAPREFEALHHPILREQHSTLVSHILQATAPVVIHAAGGVGKSVVARQIADGLPRGSLGLVYDCFGAGRYRNSSEPRHRACDGLIQIANELAAAGYCHTLLGHPGTASDALFRSFFQRLTEAVKALREIESTAILVIIIDAADNAEMAAAENGHQCFVHSLIEEGLPEGCRLVALCRTERRDLLRLKSTVMQLELKPFSEEETAIHLQNTFPEAIDADAREFKRLTGGNPRVQANALAGGRHTVEEMLADLGPTVITVGAQINGQLQAAVSGIKDRGTGDMSAQVDAICLGLANLPPFIPIAVLAEAAQIEDSAILSFVSDLGRPLWHSDSSVMFRDEPTETWFREKFAGSVEQIRRYVALLEPLAKDFPYVAKALPQLLLRAENYPGLIDLALSDNLLPDNNPIDTRNIRVYRLQFAFRAALRLGRIADAAQLAFRAGEEVAGNQRQLDLLGQNLDLVAPLLDSSRVQELAYQKMIGGAWQGSENIYSAALLSNVADFKGEARGYLRAARKWLDIYFEDKSKETERHPSQEKLQDIDIAEMSWTHLQLGGPEAMMGFLTGWRPPQLALRVGRVVVRRLVDSARFDEIEELAIQGRKSVYFTFAVVEEMRSVARFPPKKSLVQTLNQLARLEVPKPSDYHHAESITGNIVSFCEAAAARRLPADKIVAILEHYTEGHARVSIGSDFEESNRSIFLRGIALRAAVKGEPEPDPKALISSPGDLYNGRAPSRSEEDNLLQVIGGLLPWHYLRAKLIVGDPEASTVDLEKVRASAKSALTSRYRSHDRIPYEISAIRFSVLALKENVTDEELNRFATDVVARAAQKFALNHRLSALRASSRIAHLAPLRSLLERSCVATIEPASSESPEDRADSYIQLSRALFAVSVADASAYFELAIDAVSKFGDEIVPRWEAIAATARRAADGERASAQIAYRFFRCAEMVGDSVVREKYWNRSEVFRVGVRLNASASFAAMSRWRDREVGWFHRPMLALSKEAVESEEIGAMPAWCLSGFFACNADTKFVAACIRHEAAQSNRQFILDATIRDLELEGGNLESWLSLKRIAEEFGLVQDRLIELLTRHELPSPGASVPTTPEDFPPQAETTQATWETIFDRCDIMTPMGLARADSAYRNAGSPSWLENFWCEALRRVPAGREMEFLKMASEAESVGPFSLSSLLANLPQEWAEKASVKAARPGILRFVGKRYASTLAEPGYLAHWLQSADLSKSDSALIKSGVTQGLAESLDLVDATTFFGFVASVSADLTPRESLKVLDYAMDRFEVHLPHHFADGSWADWLEPPEVTVDALAGFIWSALGSPLSATRWQAVHCVRRLVEAGCTLEVNALMGWLERDTVGSFGSHRFPFYRLHARLYLLIAFARAARDATGPLMMHSAAFASLALSGMPHVLIQRTASDIALSIESAAPGSYSDDTVSALGRVGLSPFPMQKRGNPFKTVSTPWHSNGEVNIELKIHFGLDFESYWFRYLGHIFGVPGSQAEDLGREAAVKYVGIVSSDEFQSDPRRSLWESRDYYEVGTDHSHGSYPKNDDFWFYFSYHSFQSAAARLLGTMPVVQSEYDDEDPWEYWLRRHSLTRTDGLWLFDRRDPSPLARRPWVASSQERDEWRWSLSPEDFWDVLLNYSARPGWLCLAGAWTECDGSRIEHIQVSSAFVAPETAGALANALRWCRSPSDYRLPCYQDEEAELHQPPFELIGWISSGGVSEKGLDGFDPHAREIEYPPYALGEDYESILGLLPDTEKRRWARTSEGTPIFTSESWSENDDDERDQPYRSGQKLDGAIAEVCQLCGSLGKQLIISIKIDRQIHRHRGSSSRDYAYIPPSHKILILSSDGRLRDARESRQIGE